jgi:alanine dehydrogenase
MEKINKLGAFFITNEELRETLEGIGWPGFISEIRKGFEQSSLGQAQVPEKVYINTEVSDMRCMPAYMPKYSPAYCGVKIVSVAPENRKLGIPTVLGEYLLRDARTQQLLAILQAEDLTAFRTGAATGVATDALARKDARTLGIAGTGKQAYYQLKGMLAVRPNIEKIRLFDISEEYARKFKERFEREFGVDMAVSSLEETLNSDIVTTITPAREPFIPPELVRPGVHLNGVGADSKSKTEFDPRVLKKARIFVDGLEQCIHSGEVYQGLEQGLIRKEDLVSVGDVVAGKAEGRTGPEDITFFKSTGVAFQDLITAILVFERLKG